MSYLHLRQLLAAATPGPWEVYQTIHAEPWVTEAGRGMFGAVSAPATGRERYGLDNANLIAAAVTALPGLLDELDRLHALIAEQAAQCSSPGSHTTCKGHALARAVSDGSTATEPAPYPGDMVWPDGHAHAAFVSCHPKCPKFDD